MQFLARTEIANNTYNNFDYESLLLVQQIPGYSLDSNMSQNININNTEL